MWSNNIKIGLRNLKKQRTHAVINIIGLTVGIASFLLIMMYVQYELSYDSHLSKKHFLYRAIEVQHAPGVGDQHVAITMGPLGPTLKQDFPEVQDYLRIWNTGDVPITYEDKKFKQQGVVYTDPSVFSMFDIELLMGDKNEALNQVNSVVVSEKIANKLFGGVEQAYGKILTFNSKDAYKITAVMKNLPKKFHLQFEMMISFITAEKENVWIDKEWESNSFVTYLQLAPNSDVKKLESKFPKFFEKHIDIKDNAINFELYLQPITEVHLHSNYIKFQWQTKAGDIHIVHVFTLIAILILIIACINFINISISNSIKRAKEVGMRKVIGADRLNLIYQFNGETVIVTLISIVFSLGLIELFLPIFNTLLDLELQIRFISNPLFNIGLFGILFVVSVVSGAYPAYYISRFKPVNVLKGSKGKQSNSSGILTKVLVIIQFTITISLIFSILVIYKQINFVEKKDLGYNIDHVMVIPFFDEYSKKKSEYLKNELLKDPNIEGVSIAVAPNGASGTQGDLLTADSIPQQMTFRFGYVDPDFFPLMDIPLVAGRNFNKEYWSDLKGGSVILNEIAVKKLGWENPIGKRFEALYGDSTLSPKVIGVVKDYHYYSLRSKIEPAIYTVNSEYNRCLIVRFREMPDKGLRILQNGINSVVGSNLNFDLNVRKVEAVWKSFFPNTPFDYYYLKERIRELYQNERNALKIFTYFAILSILISCLGLYGLISQVIEQRTNEIGIRKVMGGSIFQILLLLIKDFIKLIVVAGILAIPLAIFFAEQALQTFVYRISMPYELIVLSILIALLIAVVTISYHAIKLASSNPIDALRAE